MGTDSAIGWTDHTFNPWQGCSHVSPGCENCYAEALGKRTGRVEWGDDAERVVTSPAYWRNPEKWDRAAEAAGRPALVFCASLADVFEDRPELRRPRSELFHLAAETKNLRWLLLTKRPENVLRLVPSRWRASWPSNVAVGTTTEDQQRADERIPHLLEVRQLAPMVFLSAEPLLGYVKLLPEWLAPRVIACRRGSTTPEHGSPAHVAELELFRAVGRKLGWAGIDWIIAGGESGPGHRPLDVDHARYLRDQAGAAAIPFFFKQHGGRTPTAGGDELDGETLKAFPEWAGDRTPSSAVEIGRRP